MKKRDTICPICVDPKEDLGRCKIPCSRCGHEHAEHDSFDDTLPPGLSRKEFLESSDHIDGKCGGDCVCFGFVLEDWRKVTIADDYRECFTCGNMSGSPELCYPCLHNRTLTSDLKIRLAELQDRLSKERENRCRLERTRP